MVERRWEVKIGPTVTATDSEYGQRQQLLVDLEQKRVVGLLARPHGWLPYHPVVVPENVIEDASEHEVRLSISRDQVEALPEYLPSSELIVNGRRDEVDDELLLMGYVERVIIDPRNRRVTAFIAHGYIPDPREKDDHKLPSDEPGQERSIVIPIHAVRYATDSSVLLEVSGAQAALYRPFNPADFINPPAKCQPLYPYRWEQVLFDWERSEEL